MCRIGLAGWPYHFRFFTVIIKLYGLCDYAATESVEASHAQALARSLRWHLTVTRGHSARD
jgi:hypothetical protein